MQRAARHDGKIVWPSGDALTSGGPRHSLEGAHMPLGSLEDAAFDRLSRYLEAQGDVRQMATAEK
jgi:hypothetical protein